MSKNIFFFIITIFLTFAVLPNVNIFVRPNLILIFLITLSLKIGFQKSIWYWIFGGLILDSINAIKFPINSFLFVLCFLLSFLLQGIFEYKTFMSKIVTGLIFVTIYFSTFIIREMFVHKGFYFSQEYLRQGLITFVLFFIIWIFNKTKNETTI